ncbi:MAG: cyclopropane-fatty-acyl-phospholipid synthase family protein [Gammaproteobacteria bacterium]|nr:cyclopropane-fatty-acyl-phospholipid synthase family protein [Gammaproteobacteria bacterium]
MRQACLNLLQKHIRRGCLELVLANGQHHHFGVGQPHAKLLLYHDSALERILRDPELMLGETYMRGEWDAADHDLIGLLELLMLNFPEQRPEQRSRLSHRFKKLVARGNRIARSYRNVAHHYDLDEWLFRRFLDEDMQYSCAYFYEPNLSLEEAQRAKCRHIMNKLRLQPGQRVLDIGCGWGGLALYLAEHAGVEVTGLTLAREQLRVAEARARERGMEKQVSFCLQDYREHHGNYDRIVSVGMFEHVGVRHYHDYFDQVRRLLADDGIALVHTIGRHGPPGATNPWIEKYIFPGGYNPALSEMVGAIEQSGLVSCDIEVLQLHYAMTLAAWSQRFHAHRDPIKQRMGERFCRMWGFYLASCEAAFRWRDLVVFQVQLTHRLGVTPITRNYLYRNGNPVTALDTCPAQEAGRIQEAN